MPNSRPMASSFRRPPAAALSTPVARPYKPGFAQPQSMVSHRYLSPSSPTSSREDLAIQPVPALRHLPQTATTSRTQARTIPARPGHLGPPQLIPLTAEERQRRYALGLDSASERSESDYEPANVAAEQSVHDGGDILGKYIAGVQALDDDEDGLAEMLQGVLRDNFVPDNGLPPIPASPIGKQVTLMCWYIPHYPLRII